MTQKRWSTVSKALIVVLVLGGTGRAEVSGGGTPPPAPSANVTLPAVTLPAVTLPPVTLPPATPPAR
jgi:hypothetical protein